MPWPHPPVWGQQIKQTSVVDLAGMALGLKVDNLAFINGAALDEKRKLLYVFDHNTPHLAVVCLTSFKLLKTVTLGDMSGEMIKSAAVHEESGAVYVLQSKAKKLWRYDPQSGVVASAAGDSYGRWVIEPQGGRLYFLKSGQGVEAYDDQLAYQGSLSLPVASGVMAAHDGRLYVVTDSSSGSGIRVAVCRADTLTVERYFSLPDSCTEVPLGMCVNDEYVFLSFDRPANRLLAIKKSSGTGRLENLKERPGPVACDNERLYLLFEEVLQEGDIHDSQAGLGAIEARQAASLQVLGRLRTDLNTPCLTLAPALNLLIYVSTGSSCVGLAQADALSKIAQVRVGTAMEEVTLRPSDDLVYVRDRLGGSLVHLYREGDAALRATISVGGWPSKVILDQNRDLLYILQHFQSKVIVCNASGGEKLGEVDLETPGRSRTHALSTLALDPSRQLLFAALPEWKTLHAVDLADNNRQSLKTIQGLTGVESLGPGSLHLAVNEKDSLLYVFLSATETLNIYDGPSLSLLKQVSVSGVSECFPKTHQNLLFFDPHQERLFVGSAILDPWGATLGSLPSGALKVIAGSPEGDRLYCWGASQDGANEYLIAYDGQLTSRQWELMLPNPCNAFGSVAVDHAGRKLVFSRFCDGMIYFYGWEGD